MKVFRPKIITLLVLAVVFLRPAATHACGGEVTVKADRSEYKASEKVDATVFFNSDGNCASNKISIKTTFNIAGQFTEGATVACPQQNQGNDIWCVLVDGGKTYQYHTIWQFPSFPAGTQQAFLEGWVYVDGTLYKKNLLNLKPAGEGAAATAPPAGVAAAKPEKPLEVALSVAIGNIANVGSIGQYIGAIYTYALGLVTVLAVSMVVLGGIKYLTAGANPSRVSSAKQTMSNAFIGLLLALATYLILSTINPNLVTLKPLVVPKVKKILFQSGNWCEDVNLGLYSVDPPLPQDCGKESNVTAKQAGANVLNPKCVHRSCPAPNQCAINPSTKKYECLNCAYVDDARLTAMGKLNPADSDCAPYVQTQSDKKGYYACVYGSDTGFKGRGCEFLKVDCANIKSCDDYTKWVAVFPKDSPPEGFAATYERSCYLSTWTGCAGALGATGPQITPKPAGHLAQVCLADPCGVGPCATKDNQELSKFEKITGFAWFQDANLQYCVKK